MGLIKIGIKSIGGIDHLTAEQKLFLLCDAAANFNSEKGIGEELIQAGANVNGEYEGKGAKYRGRTPLTLAVAFRNYPLIKLLMENGAKSSQEQQEIAFALAINGKDYEFQTKLIKEGLALDTKVNGTSLFESLIETRQAKTFIDLLKDGFSFTDAQKKALMDMTVNFVRSLDLLTLQKQLIESGMNVNGMYGIQGHRNNLNLLGQQLSKGSSADADMVLFLLDHGGKVVGADRERFIIFALKFDSLGLIKRSFAFGFEINGSILAEVVKCNVKVQEEFLEACSLDKLHASAMYAVENSDLPFLQKIVALHKIDLNVAYQGRTLADICIKQGLFGTMLDFLLEEGMQLTSEQKTGALKIAVSKGNVGAVKKLVAMGANVLEKVSGMAALQRARIQYSNTKNDVNNQILQILEKAAQAQAVSS